ncbi:MAG: fibronectin type III domain-containing protein, partial [Deltaproteobacteria bacterium]
MPSALYTAGLAVIATLGALFPRTAVASATFVQGTAFSTGSRVPAITVTLTHAVAQGDLLVGWFAQYNAPEQVAVSDNVNGTWRRAAAGALTFDDDTGDIALYYRENSQAAPGGISITVSVSSTAYLQGTVADYSGVALAGALDQIAAGHGNETVPVDTGPTPPVDAGELVFAALVTDVSARSVTPGSSQGVRYTARAQNSSVSAFEEDITSSAAGAQHGTATISSSAAEWYAVCAVFHPYPATPPVPPSTPTGLEATSVASTRVALAWSPSSGSVAGYTVYRNGSPIGTTGPDTTIFLDWDLTPATTHTYSVDAFDLTNDHSALSAPLTVTTPAVSPEFVQGVAASPASRLTSLTLTLSEPVLAGDLLVGWFGQYNASGQVRVTDNVNGAWTRSVSTTWGGAGDIALYYRQNSAAAPSGLRITVSASASAYLQEAIADFRHVATVGALDQAVVAQGVGNYASVGPTSSVPAGELVVAAVLTGGQPRWATPGSSQMVPYLLDVQNGSD